MLIPEGVFYPRLIVGIPMFQTSTTKEATAVVFNACSILYGSVREISSLKMYN
jgi:hypothetical protein